MNMTHLLSVVRVIGRVAEIGVNHIYDEAGQRDRDTRAQG